jgi:hypothetical protein
MKEELELQLVKKYPKILRDYRGDMMETCMAWGIETGDGWYDLLDECMGKMQLICDLASTEENQVQVIAEQIKTKFASLRFYYRVEGLENLDSEKSKIIWNIISDMENRADLKSSRTCEICGKNGKTNESGWLTTLCEEHSKKKTKPLDDVTEF